MKKSITFFVLILISLVSVISNRRNEKNLKQVPRGADLKNHYGVNPNKSKYGESDFDLEHFVKENHKELTDLDEPADLSGFIYEDGNNLIPQNIKSGSLSNIANSATGLLTPKNVNPTLHISTEVKSPKVVEVSELTGYENKVIKVNAYDKQLNLVKKQNVLINSPIYSKERQVAYVPTKMDMSIDMKEGTITKMSGDPETKVNVGIERD